MLSKIKARTGFLLEFLIGLIAGFVLASGNLFTYLNYNYRALLMFNLQYFSTVALIYFAWRQYRFTQLEHANAEFELVSAEIAFASLRKSREKNKLTEFGDVVSINCEIRNIGEGYADLLDFEEANIRLTETENNLFSMHIVRSNFSKQINSRIAPGESLNIKIDEFKKSFNQRDLNEKISPDKNYNFENFRLKFFSDKDKHNLSTDEIKIQSRDKLLNEELN